MRNHLSKMADIAAAAAMICGASMSTAQAACSQASLTGTWRVGIVAHYPKGGGWTGVCEYAIKANGKYTGSCTYQGTGDQTPTAEGGSHGTFKVNAKCQISGVMSAPNVHDTKVTSGFLKGNTAMISGARDAPATQVRLLTMIRK